MTGVSGVRWRGVRWRADVGWEMRCDECAAAKRSASYWPISHEFWDVRRGLWRCRACWVAYTRDRRRQGKYSAQRAAKTREYQREWAARKRQQLREAEGRQRYERRKAA